MARAQLVAPDLLVLEEMEVPLKGLSESVGRVKRLELKLDGAFGGRFKRVLLDGADLRLPLDMVFGQLGGLQGAPVLIADSLPPEGIHVLGSRLILTSPTGDDLVEFTALSGAITRITYGVQVQLTGESPAPRSLRRTFQAAVELRSGRLIRSVSVAGEQLELARVLMPRFSSTVSSLCSAELSGRLHFRDTDSGPVLELEGDTQLDLETIAEFLRMGSFKGQVDLHISKLVVSTWGVVVGFKGEFRSRQPEEGHYTVSFQALNNLHYLLNGEYIQLTPGGEVAYTELGCQLSWDGRFLSINGLLEPTGSLLLKGEDGRELLCRGTARIRAKQLWERLLKLKAAQFICRFHRQSYDRPSRVRSFSGLPKCELRAASEGV